MTHTRIRATATSLLIAAALALPGIAHAVYPTKYSQQAVLNMSFRDETGGLVAATKFTPQNVLNLVFDENAQALSVTISGVFQTSSGIFSGYIILGGTLGVRGEDAWGYSLEISSSILMGGCIEFYDGSRQCVAASDPDLTPFLRIDGTRAMTGPLTLVGSSLTVQGATSLFENVELYKNGYLTLGGTVESNTAPHRLMIIGRKARAGPSPVIEGDFLLSMFGRGWDGDGYDTGPQVDFMANETWDGASHGSYINFNTVRDGFTVVQTRMRIDHNGNIGINTIDPTAKLDVNGDGVFRGHLGATSSGTIAGNFRVGGTMAAQALVSSSVVAGVTGVFSGAHSASSYSGDGSALTGVGSAAAAALTIAGKAAEAGISKGMCLYISGATGQTPSLSLADNTIDAKDEILGLAAEDIANNNNGLVRIAGLLTGVDTDGTGVPGSSESWNDGDELFCSTSGLLTKVEPTAGTVRHIGYVAYAHGTNGKIIVATHQEHFMGAPAGADMSLRMGDSAGATKISFKDYSNAEVASVNSDGVFTGTEFVGPLTGTADQAVLASQATQLAATTPCQEPGFISRGMTVAGLDICVEVLDAEVDGSSLPVSGKALFDHDATADAHHAKAVSGDITHDSTVGGIAAAAHHAKAVSGDITHDSTIGGTTDDAHFDHADDLAELNAQTGASLADGPHVDLSGEVNIAPGTSFTSTFTSTGNLELGGGELSGSAGELTFNGIVHETTNPAVLVKTNTAQLMPTGGWQNIFFDEAEYEYTDMWSVSVSSDRVTIPAKGDGLYDTKCATEWAGNSTSYRITQIIKNGSRMEFKQENISESSAFKQEVSRRMELVAGDYISCLVVQATGGNLGVHATTAGQFSYLEVIKVR